MRISPKTRSFIRSFGNDLWHPYKILLISHSLKLRTLQSGVELYWSSLRYTAIELLCTCLLWHFSALAVIFVLTQHHLISIWSSARSFPTLGSANWSIRPQDILLLDNWIFRIHLPKWVPKSVRWCLLKIHKNLYSNLELDRDFYSSI